MDIIRKKPTTMREIKFRVWDNQKNALANENDVRPSLGFEFGTKDYFINIAGERMARWSFMQYTGLKDKNGKEIYEGDLVRYDGKYGEFIGTVTYEQQACAFWLKYNDGKTNRYQEMRALYGDGEVYLNEYYEVIVFDTITLEVG